jgi:DDE family transposase
MAAGRGAVVAVHEITGIARSTIGRGLDELNGPELPDGRVRREGGGRYEVADVDPTLVTDLQRLVEPVTMGDPERPLKWVSKSPVKLADELRKQVHEVSPNTVSKLLSEAPPSTAARAPRSSRRSRP